MSLMVDDAFSISAQLTLPKQENFYPASIFHGHPDRMSSKAPRYPVPPRPTHQPISTRAFFLVINQNSKSLATWQKGRARRMFRCEIRSPWAPAAHAEKCTTNLLIAGGQSDNSRRK